MNFHFITKKKIKLWLLKILRNLVKGRTNCDTVITKNKVIIVADVHALKVEKENFVEKEDFLEKLEKEDFLENQSERFIFVEKEKRHPFHIVQPSPWPFLCAMSITGIFIGLFVLMNSKFYTYDEIKLYSFFGFLPFFLPFSLWIRDILRETTLEFNTHNLRTQKGLSIGFLLFILSETMFFVSFFWAFFHSSLSPSVWIFLEWPPKGINILNPMNEPLLNTIILVTSGLTINLAYTCIKRTLKYEPLLELNKDNIKDLYISFFKEKNITEKKKKLSFLIGNLYIKYAGHLYYIITLILGFLFLKIQFKEYQHANFDISDGIYGSCFYLLTGFHGLHVLLGLIYLFFQFMRYSLGHFSLHYIINKKTVMLGLQTAIWYWHFVDVIWLALYLILYIWGSREIEDINAVNTIAKKITEDFFESNK